MFPASKMVMAPAIGSTIPLNVPYKNDFHFPFPFPASGIEMIAPSGKFCIAIPIERASAPADEIPELADASHARTTPTAIPSGILWRVTARQSMVVFFSFDFTPSGFSELTCRCGIIESRSRRNKNPSARPTAAGTKANFPIDCDSSIAGIKSDQTEAATITPDAKPSSVF